MTMKMKRRLTSLLKLKKRNNMISVISCNSLKIWTDRPIDLSDKKNYSIIWPKTMTQIQIETYPA